MSNTETQADIRQFLRDKRITLHVNEQEFSRLPKEPFILVCNQLEEADDWILLYLISHLSLPIKILPARRLRKPPEVQSFFLQENQVSLLSMPESGKRLDKLLQQAATALDNNMSLALAIDFQANRLNNRPLRRTLNVLKRWQRPIVPVRIVSEKEPTFFNQFSPKIIQRLANTPLDFTVRIGNPITVEEQQRFDQIERFRKFIQSKIFALGTKLKIKPFFFNPLKYIPRSEQNEEETLIEPIASELIIQDIKNLTFKNLIASRAQFDVLIAGASELPHVMQEIGRLRELTFRQVGEGTGKSLDLDEYDLYYKQLIIWDREAQKIVGGYRLGEGDIIFRQFGAEGFYIHSLFKIGEGFFPIMQQSVELGRSYVVPEYQKHRLSLFLLWKGILFFLLQNPQYRYLYGPLSISKNYSSVSQSVIVAFIKRYYFREDLAQFLTPRKPFRIQTEKVDVEVLMQGMNDEIQSLDKFIEDIEPDHFRIPVLLKQYVKLNARFISFNVDPNFSDVLDGFIILDLNDVPLSMIEALKKEV